MTNPLRPLRIVLRRLPFGKHRGTGEAALPETIAVQTESARGFEPISSRVPQQTSSQSFGELWLTIWRNRRLFLSTVGSLLCSCLLYCLIAPNVYEATARVVLHGTQVSLLALDRNEGATSGSFASGQVQLETLANVLRSDQLAWDVITRLQLYKDGGFRGTFPQKFPDFSPSHTSPEARDWLLDRFQNNLTVQTIPRTLVLQIRFRSRDAALSAAVVNALIHAYNDRTPINESRPRTMPRGRCARN